MPRAATLLSSVLLATGLLYAEECPRVHVGAYWWDGWFEGSPYIRAPLTTEFAGREPVWGWRGDRQEVADQCIQLAAKYGIDFFAFLWYPPAIWAFPGGQPSGVMNNGLRFFLASQTPERRHVGFLIMVVHAPKADDWEQTCRQWAREYLSHERSQRIEGRPALFFYELSELERKLNGCENVKHSLETLRRIAREAGCPNPFLVLRAQGAEASQLRSLGFDGATDYANAYASPGEHPYESLIACGRRTWDQYAGRRLNYIPSITAGWDGRPREWQKQPYYRYWFRRSPDDVGHYVRTGLDWIRAHPQDVPRTPMLMIYAWNEVDEGGAICPTKKEGAAYLQALRNAVDFSPKPP
jgi:hypothetical protein